jgi:type IV secretory pathway VirB4 component
MMPFSAVWAGPERDEHFQAPSLFFARTEGSTQFRFSLHVGDVGHTLIVGPTGAGKSVLLALMALQFRRYAGAQIFAFDFGGRLGPRRSPWAAHSRAPRSRRGDQMDLHLTELQ